MIIKGGRVFKDKSFSRADIKVADDCIVEIAPEIVAASDEDVVDATGCLVTPGLIDFHVHAFKYGIHLGIDIDAIAPQTGVTTFVDQGSVGALQFPAFRKFVIDETLLNLFAYLNISLIGQTTSGIRGLDFHDNDSRAFIHLPLAEEIIEKNRDIIRGIKVRVYTGMKDLYALEQAKVLSKKVGLPVLVHIGPSPPSVKETLALLDAGDMFTHPYHGGSDNLLDDNGRVRPEFIDARDRGVEIDLGMDRFHCDLTIMKSSFDQGYYPDFISSDLTLTNINSVTFDLPTTIAKCVACGMSLEQAIYLSSKKVAKKIGVANVAGALDVGRPADIAVFNWQESTEPLVDFFGNEIKGAHRLTNVATILRGKRLMAKTSDLALLDNSEVAVPWKNY